MSDIATKLDEARAMIEKGWCQNAWREGDCVCALQAIDEVGWTGYDDLSGDMRQAFLSVVHGKTVTEWNDKPGRTQAEVIEAFRKAAELARGESA